MTDNKGTNPEATYVADKFSGFGISEDGSAVRIQMTAGEGHVYMTLPSKNLPELYVNLGMLLDSLVMGKVLPEGTNKPLRSPQKWKVGQSTDKKLAKFTMLVFDDGLQQESAILLSDVDALKIADAIEQKVLAGMPPEQQRQMIQNVEAARGRAKGTLILPPGKL